MRFWFHFDVYLNCLFAFISGKDLSKQKSHTVHLGNILDGNRIIDEVLATVFKNPSSYTGENVVEFSCHGSSYIQQEIIQLSRQILIGRTVQR